MPFKVDHKLSVNIATQVTDGIRNAILSGFYKPGDILPKAMDFTHGLHVSIRATQAAYRALKREGLISPRRRLGTLVVGQKADVFHGRVVIVSSDDNPSYYNAVIGKRLSRRLNEAGYVVANVTATLIGDRKDDADKERFDVRQLSAALRQNTSLAVVVGSAPPLERAISAMGTPFIELGVTKPIAPGCVGFAALDINCALHGVLERLRAHRVRSLVQMGIRHAELMDSEELRRTCESYDELVVWPKHVKSATQEEIVRAAYDLVQERYRDKGDLPDAFLFADDYLARGALLALLAAGIRTGSDVLVITLANKGTTPLHIHPVDLLQRNPVRDADAVSDAILAYLQTGKPAEDITLETVFVAD